MKKAIDSSKAGKMWDAVWGLKHYMGRLDLGVCSMVDTYQFLSRHYEYPIDSDHANS